MIYYGPQGAELRSESINANISGSQFCVSLWQILDRNNLKEKKSLFWFMVSEVSVHHRGKRMAEQLTLKVARKNDYSSWLSHFLPFIPYWLSAYQMVPPTCREILSPLVKPLWNTYSEICFTNLLGAFNLIKLTTKINYHTWQLFDLVNLLYRFRP
jgi:hypothetical protein